MLQKEKPQAYADDAYGNPTKLKVIGGDDRMVVVEDENEQRQQWNLAYQSVNGRKIMVDGKYYTFGHTVTLTKLGDPDRITQLLATSR